MKKVRVVYDPASGKELLKKSLADILQILEEAGFEASAYATTLEPNSAKNEARRVVELGSDLVVAAGSDGTINEVANGTIPPEHHPKMAIIPTGTTNDCARALKIPRDNTRAVAKVIKKHQIVKMDIGLSDSSYFINIAAGGYSTELIYEVLSELKSIFGYLAYLAKGAEMSLQVKPIKMRSKYDEGEYIGDVSMFFLGLANSVGGFEQIVPDVKLNDSRFSLIIVKIANIFEVLHIAVLMLNGDRHVDDPRVAYTKISSLLVGARDDIDRPVMINSDGEYGGEAPMHFQSLHQHIEFFADTGQIPDEAITGTDEEGLEVVSKESVKEVERSADEDIDGDRKIADETPNQKN